MSDESPETLREIAAHFAAAYDDLNLDDEEAIDPSGDEDSALALVERNYLTGDCGAFAVALHQRTGWPIHRIRAARGGVHYYVEDPEGRPLDFSGFTSLEAIMARYGMTSQDTETRTVAPEEACLDLDEAAWDPWHGVNVAHAVIDLLGREPFASLPPRPPLEMDDPAP